MCVVLIRQPCKFTAEDKNDEWFLAGHWSSSSARSGSSDLQLSSRRRKPPQPFYAAGVEECSHSDTFKCWRSCPEAQNPVCDKHERKHHHPLVPTSRLQPVPRAEGACPRCGSRGRRWRSSGTGPVGAGWFVRESIDSKLRAVPRLSCQKAQVHSKIGEEIKRESKRRHKLSPSSQKKKIVWDEKDKTKSKPASPAPRAHSCSSQRTAVCEGLTAAVRNVGQPRSELLKQDLTWPEHAAALRKSCGGSPGCSSTCAPLCHGPASAASALRNGAAAAQRCLQFSRILAKVS